LDGSWFEGRHVMLPMPNHLKSLRIFAQDMRWDELEFETREDAYAFVAQEIRDGRVPGIKYRRRGAPTL
jgi:hypothetical protein